MLRMTLVLMVQVKCVLDGISNEDVEFPMNVSPAERAVIEKYQSEPAPIILVGRSGTGKTTCAVLRILSQWLVCYEQKATFNQLFITASATLKHQV